LRLNAAAGTSNLKGSRAAHPLVPMTGPPS
jgi:hypothetical protein